MSSLGSSSVRPRWAIRGPRHLLSTSRLRAFSDSSLDRRPHHCHKASLDGLRKSRPEAGDFGEFQGQFRGVFGINFRFVLCISYAYGFFACLVFAGSRVWIRGWVARLPRIEICSVCGPARGRDVPLSGCSCRSEPSESCVGDPRLRDHGMRGGSPRKEITMA